MSKTMAELVRLAQAGDQDAVSQLYEQTYNSVYQAVRAIVQDEDQAQDIVQESFIKGFREIGNLGDPERFQTWMKVIGGNCARDYLRKRRPVLFSERVDEDGEEIDLRHPDDCPDHMPEDVVDRQETTRLIDEILSRLSPEQRMAVVMHYYEELSIRQIAQEQGCSENTVKSRLKYARDKIEKEVRDLEKKGTKLYSLAPMPFFLFLLRMAKKQGVEVVAEGAAAAVEICAGGAAAGSSASGSAAAGAVVKTAGGAAGKTLATKIVAGTLALTLVTGAGVVAVNSMEKDSEPETVAVDLNAEAHVVYEDFLERYVYAYSQGSSAVFEESDRYWNEISAAAAERYPEDMPATFVAWELEHIPGKGFKGGISLPESWYDLNMDKLLLVSTTMEDEEVRYAFFDIDGDGVEEMVIAKFYRGELLRENLSLYGVRDGRLYRGSVDWEYSREEGYSWAPEPKYVHESAKPRSVQTYLGEDYFDMEIEIPEPELEWHLLFRPDK